MDAYKIFREENKNSSISFSKFASLRPRHVKTMNKNVFNNCLCEYCTNIELKIKAINLIIGGKSIMKSRYDLSAETLCPKDNGSKFHKKNCIERNCDLCGSDKLKTDLTNQLKKKCTILEWHKWENQSIMDQGKKKTRKMLQLKKDSVDAFIEEFSYEIETFSAHLHNAVWQYEQFSTLTKNVPDKWTIFCMDFAENYTCLYQDECQSAHWSHSQVTLFSIVAYYQCPTCKTSMNESLVFVTSDRHHDVHAVHTFVTKANEYLKASNIGIDKQIHFSDGAPSQFKSKTPFEDVRKGCEDYGFPVEKHFFGTRHGKGPCDGEFGVVKRTVSNAVMGRKTIVTNAEEFHAYAKEALSKPSDKLDGCCHSRRTFLFVEEKDIVRKRPDRINVKGIPNTRKKHGVKSLEDQTLATRLLSCFCKACIDLNGICENIDHVEKWERVGNDKTKTKRNAAQSRKRATGKEGQQVPANDTRTKDEKKKKDLPSKKRTVIQKPKQSTAKKDNQGVRQSNRKAKDKIVKTKGKQKEEANATYIEIDLTQPMDRRDYFHSILQILQSFESFNDMQAKCIEISESQEFLTHKLLINKTINMVNNHLIADKQALGLLPQHRLREEYKSWLPVRVIGDGNCLPRSASVACFGEETAHDEIRARIVIEMCLHKDDYTSNKYLIRGMEFPQKEAANLVKTYTMFSEHYIVGDKITPAVTNRIFEAETMDVVNGGVFMGIWQLFALSSCTNAVLYSIYPERGDLAPRLTLNRKILPREVVNQTSPDDLLIMWSTTRNDMLNTNWVPNHFVPLIPPIPVVAQEMDFIQDEEDNFALDDTEMMTLLQTVTEVTFEYDNCITDTLANTIGTGDRIITVDLERPLSDEQLLEIGSKNVTALSTNNKESATCDQSNVDASRIEALDDLVLIQQMTDRSAPEIEHCSELSILNDTSTEDDSPNEIKLQSGVSALLGNHPMEDGSTSALEKLSKALEGNQPLANTSAAESKQPTKAFAMDCDQFVVDCSKTVSEQPLEISDQNDDQSMVNGSTTESEQSTTETEQHLNVEILLEDQSMVHSSSTESEQLTEVPVRNDDHYMANCPTTESDQPFEVSCLNQDQSVANGSTTESDQPSEVSGLNQDQYMASDSTTESDRPSEVSGLNQDQSMANGSTFESDQPSEVSGLNQDHSMAN